MTFMDSRPPGSRCWPGSPASTRPGSRPNAPSLVADPRVNGSIAPISRDPRFDPHGPRCKDHLLFRWWEDSSSKTAPTLFVRLDPPGSASPPAWRSPPPAQAPGVTMSIGGMASVQLPTDQVAKMTTALTQRITFGRPLVMFLRNVFKDLAAAAALGPLYEVLYSGPNRGSDH